MQQQEALRLVDAVHSTTGDGDVNTFRIDPCARSDNRQYKNVFDRDSRGTGVSTNCLEVYELKGAQKKRAEQLLDRLAVRFGASVTAMPTPGNTGHRLGINLNWDRDSTG